MTLKELIEILQKLPQEKEVRIFWDGAPRGNVDGVINDDETIIIVGEWGGYGRKEFSEDKIVYG